MSDNKEPSEGRLPAFGDTFGNTGPGKNAATISKLRRSSQSQSSTLQSERICPANSSGSSNASKSAPGSSSSTKNSSPKSKEAPKEKGTNSGAEKKTTSQPPGAFAPIKPIASTGAKPRTYGPSTSPPALVLIKPKPSAESSAPKGANSGTSDSTGPRPSTGAIRKTQYSESRRKSGTKRPGDATTSSLSSETVSPAKQKKEEAINLPSGEDVSSVEAKDTQAEQSPKQSVPSLVTLSTKDHSGQAATIPQVHVAQQETQSRKSEPASEKKSASITKTSTSANRPGTPLVKGNTRRNTGLKQPSGRTGSKYGAAQTEALDLAVKKKCGSSETAQLGETHDSLRSKTTVVKSPIKNPARSLYGKDVSATPAPRIEQTKNRTKLAVSEFSAAVQKTLETGKPVAMYDGNTIIEKVTEDTSKRQTKYGRDKVVPNFTLTILGSQQPVQLIEAPTLAPGRDVATSSTANLRTRPVVTYSETAKENRTELSGTSHRPSTPGQAEITHKAGEAKRILVTANSEPTSEQDEAGIETAAADVSCQTTDRSFESESIEATASSEIAEEEIETAAGTYEQKPEKKLPEAAEAERSSIPPAVKQSVLKPLIPGFASQISPRFVPIQSEAASDEMKSENPAEESMEKYEEISSEQAQSLPENLREKTTEVQPALLVSQAGAEETPSRRSSRIQSRSAERVEPFQLAGAVDTPETTPRRTRSSSRAKNVCEECGETFTAESPVEQRRSPRIALRQSGASPLEAATRHSVSPKGGRICEKCRNAKATSSEGTETLSPFTTQQRTSSSARSSDEVATPPTMTKSKSSNS